MVPDYDAILRPMVETFAKEQRRKRVDVITDMRDALDRIEELERRRVEDRLLDERRAPR